MFRKCILISFIFTCLISCLYAQEEAADANPSGEAFKKPVTLKIIGGEMSDLARELSKQTGTEIRAPKDIADRKLTVIVDDKPADLVIKGVMTLFGYRFSSKKLTSRTVYEFWETQKQKQQREIDWNNGISEGENNIESIFANPLGKENVLLTDKELIKLKQERLDEVRSGKGYLSHQETIPIAYFIRTIPLEQQKALLKGYTLCYDSRSPEPAWKLPEDVAHVLANVEFNPFVKDADTRANEIVECKYAKIQIKPNITISSDGYKINFDSYYAIIFDQPNLDRVSCFDDFYKQVEYNTAANRLPQEISAELLNTKLEITRVEVDKASNVQGQSPLNERAGLFINRSDLLNLLHEKLGIQVISDHISEWRMAPDIDKEDNKTFGDLLNELSNNARPFPVFYGGDKDFIYMYYKDEKKTLDNEIPNSVLDRIRIMYEDREMNFEESAELSLLRTEQLELLDRNFNYLVPNSITKTSKYSLDIKNQGLPFLRFYGSLTKAQREVLKRDRLIVSGLSAKSKRYLEAFFTDHACASIFNSSEFPVVGMYKDGIRVDKSQSYIIDSIAAIALRDTIKEKSTGYYGEPFEYDSPCFNYIITFKDGTEKVLRTGYFR